MIYSKACLTCGITKELEEFSKDKNRSDGHHGYCKVCSRIRYKEYSVRCKVSIAARQKVSNKKCKVKRSATKKAYQEKNKEEYLAYLKVYREKYREELNSKNREYEKKHREYLNTYKKEYRKKRREEDEEYNIRCILRARITSALKNNTKTGSSLQYLGCDIAIAKAHIEAQFEPWMTWENHGLYTWHIDHIVPICNFNMLDEEERKLAFHYTNLQPLSAKDNLTKGKYIIRKKIENDTP